MPRHKTYTQCRLRRPSEGGHQVLESWIPTELAKKGLVVNLKDDLGEWTDGWTVMEVWGTRPGEQVEAAVPDYRHQRKVSDV